MKYINLKSTSLKLSAICLGAGGFGSGTNEAAAFELLDAFFEAGGNFIDTANVYGKWEPDKKNHSEITIGRWLKSKNAADKNDKIVVATKGAHYDLSAPDKPRLNKQDIKQDLEESLISLGLDCIGLYWLHRDDEKKHVGEIVETMESFVKEGKIRYYGASNYKLNRMEEASEYAKKNNCRGFCAVSNQWSLAYENINPEAKSDFDPTLAGMTKEFYNWHKETKMPSIPYSSTASGFFEKLFKADPKIENGKLATPYEELNLPEHMKKAYINEKNLKIYEELLEQKNKYGYSLYTLSVALLAKQPFDVIPISSVRNIGQLNGFLQAGDILL